MRSNKDQWYSPATPCSKLGQPALDSAPRQGKERVFVITPKGVLLIQYECPFALGCNLYSGCLLDQWIFWLGEVYTNF